MQPGNKETEKSLGRVKREEIAPEGSVWVRNIAVGPGVGIATNKKKENIWREFDKKMPEGGGMVSIREAFSDKGVKLPRQRGVYFTPD